jgi:hypothetical protein
VVGKGRSFILVDEAHGWGPVAWLDELHTTMRVRMGVRMSVWWGQMKQCVHTEF